MLRPLSSRYFRFGPFPKIRSIVDRHLSSSHAKARMAGHPREWPAYSSVRSALPALVLTAVLLALATLTAALLPLTVVLAVFTALLLLLAIIVATATALLLVTVVVVAFHFRFPS